MSAKPLSLRLATTFPKGRMVLGFQVLCRLLDGLSDRVYCLGESLGKPLHALLRNHQSAFHSWSCSRLTEESEFHSLATTGTSCRRGLKMIDSR